MTIVHTETTPAAETHPDDGALAAPPRPRSVPMREALRSGGKPATQTPALLDQVLPRYAFAGRYETTVYATAEDVFRALQEVTLVEMPLGYALGALRYLPETANGRFRKRPDPNVGTDRTGRSAAARYPPRVEAEWFRAATTAG